MTAFLTLLALHAFASAQGAPDVNLVYLLADDLGYSDLSFHTPAPELSSKNTTVLTPNIHELATGANGLILEQFYGTKVFCSAHLASFSQ